MGLVNKVVPMAEAGCCREGLTDKLAQRSPTAIALAKRSFNADSDNIRGISNPALHAVKLFYDTADREGKASMPSMRSAIRLPQIRALPTCCQIARSMTKEHALLRDSVRRFAAARIAPRFQEWERLASSTGRCGRRAGEAGLLCPQVLGPTWRHRRRLFVNAVVIEELGLVPASPVRDGFLGS